MIHKVNDSTEQNWIAVDLDGTLASNEFTTDDPLHIGPPIPSMLERVQRWLREGKVVKIFTARVAMDCGVHSVYRIRETIEDWCLQNVGQRLEVTCSKDYLCSEIWDDRSVSVQENTGKYVRFTEAGVITR